MCGACWDTFILMGLSPDGSWFIIVEEGKQSMLSILNRVMPGGGDGGGGGDLDLILDNDTIQPHMGKSGATFPRGRERGDR